MSNFGHIVNISDISVRGAPRAVSTFNELDSFGVLLGLERLPEEPNRDYKRRLLDVFTRRASSTYTGLINGITRELGLEFFKPVVFTKLSSAEDPYIEFIENEVRVWRNKTELELTISRSDPLDNGYWLGDLVSIINSDSSYFNAALNTGVEFYTRSDTLLNQSSKVLVGSQKLEPSHINNLKHLSISKQSLYFSDRDTFKQEVLAENLVNSSGKYYVNYSAGVIKSFSVPSVSATIRYEYNIDNFEPLASPVIIKNLQSDIFKQDMFLKTGIPSRLGTAIINELLSVYPMYWGK